jgi:hypothetical protein
MKPEQAAVQARERGDEAIAPAHVRIFVSQHRVKCCPVPAAPFERQKYVRTQSHRDGHH